MTTSMGDEIDNITPSLNRPDSRKIQFLTKLPAPSFAEGMLWLQMQVTHIL